ncbi:MAG: DUF3857 and transglutaminase domain-containing protein [Gemmatimonadetes bacterium]|nr:DUF3857 and transglutaminase domain-containing protein [Gemmatimonadota bacterium]
MKALVTRIAPVLLAALVSGSAPSIATAGPSDWKWGEIEREELFAPHFPEAPYADAIVLLDHHVVRVDAKERLKQYHHHRTRIMKEGGRDRGVVSIRFHSDDEIKNFRAQTIVPPGHQVEVKGDAIQKIEGPVWTEWVLTFPSIQPGVVIEYEYEIRSDRLDRVAPMDFRERDLVRMARVDLQLPFDISHETFFGWSPGAPEAVKSQINDPDDTRRQLNQWTWEAEGVEPLAQEPLEGKPADYAMTLYVQLVQKVGTGNDPTAGLRSVDTNASVRSVNAASKEEQIRKSWEEVAKESFAALGKMWEKDSGVDKFVAGATAGASSPEAKARALFFRVRDGITTTAAADIRGSETLRGVIESGKGTSLAKNLLLMRVLREANIDGRVVKVPVSRSLQPRWYCADQFDGAVVRAIVDGKTVWLDPATPGCPYGMLAPDKVAAQGLLIGPDGGLVDVKVGDVNSQRNIQSEATIEDDGSVAVKADVKLAGYPEVEARAAIAKKGEAEWAEQWLRARFGTRVELGAVRLDEGPAFLAHVEFRLPGAAEKIAGGWRGSLPWLTGESANEFESAERESPVDFGYVAATDETITLHVPDGLSVKAPEGETVRMAEVNYQVSHAPTATGLQSSRAFRVREPMVMPTEYAKLRDSWSRIAAADGAEFKTMTGARTAGTR